MIFEFLAGINESIFFQERFGLAKFRIELVSMQNLMLKGLRPCEFLLLSLEIEKRLNVFKSNGFKLEQHSLLAFFDVETQSELKDVKAMASDLFNKLDKKNNGYVRYKKILELKLKKKSSNIDLFAFQQSLANAAGYKKVFREPFISNFIKCWKRPDIDHFLLIFLKNDQSAKKGVLLKKIKSDAAFLRKVKKQALVIGHGGKETFLDVV